MGASHFRGAPAGGAASLNPGTGVPASCPTCRSSSITTTAKIPDSSSYWRCTKCGEIWNDSRRDVSRHGGDRWR